MMFQRLGIVAILIVVILGLHVWRGQLPDVGRSSLNGDSSIGSSDLNLASPAGVPTAKSKEKLLVLNEMLPSRDKKRLEIVEEILAAKNDNDGIRHEASW